MRLEIRNHQISSGFLSYCVLPKLKFPTFLGLSITTIEHVWFWRYRVHSIEQEEGTGFSEFMVLRVRGRVPVNSISLLLHSVLKRPVAKWPILHVGVAIRTSGPKRLGRPKIFRDDLGSKLLGAEESEPIQWLARANGILPFPGRIRFAITVVNMFSIYHTFCTNCLRGMSAPYSAYHACVRDCVFVQKTPD